MQLYIRAKGFKNMTHGVVLDPHLHFVATAVKCDLGVRLCWRKSRQTHECEHCETAKS